MIGGVNVADEETVSEPLLKNFSWVVPDLLAGMALPGQNAPLINDLTILTKEYQVEMLVSLTEEPLDEIIAAEVGLTLLHIPVEDFHAPTIEQLRQFCEATHTYIEETRPVAVHCHAGQGRTGTFLASWFIYNGMSAKKAIEYIRLLRPGSIETTEQEQVLYQFEISLKEKSP